MGHERRTLGSERDHGDTQTLRAIAPAAAEWPRWWRRNFTPAALYTIGAVILSAVVTVTAYIVTGRQDRNELAKVTALADQIAATQTEMAKTLAVVSSNVQDLKAWQLQVTKPAIELENPYVRSRPKLRKAPAPPPSAKP